MPDQSDLLQGTLDVLVLKALTWGPRHGHAIARMIRNASGGAFEVLDGSLYAALHRLEEREWVDAEWGISDNNRKAKFYRLTTTGKKQLRDSHAYWARFANAVTKVLETAPSPA